MKKALFTALVISASVCAASAQNHKAEATSQVTTEKEAEHKSTETKRARDWQNTLATELKLTDDQSKKIAELHKAFGERRQAIHNNPNLTDEVKQERKMALKKAMDAQFEQVLTTEQQTRYKELMEARQ